MSKTLIASEAPITKINVDVSQPKKFTGTSVEDEQPVSYPLSTLNELLSWKIHDVNDHGQLFSVATVPHTPKIRHKFSTQTLFCHDMKGGYLPDRFVQGLSCNDDIFYFKYWNLVDIFVYFSHHFVTIPPVGWINSAHRNGITVLGTFITEFKDGYERCKQIFADEKSWKAVADQLCKLTEFYCFDGWLLNIENDIDSDIIPNLVDFVAYLTAQLHNIDCNALVIWYDAVTADGKLKWQNELNLKNSCFYNACDGIFLNYSWQEENLAMSKLHAKNNLNKVYVGVDVFGRGSYGGGGFNTKMALKVIHRYNMSIALFAPGWLYEEFGPFSFEKNSRRFWDSLKPYCVSYPVDCSKGLVSRFNPGGDCRVWSYLNGQDLMPLLPQPCALIEADSKAKTGNLILDFSKSPENVIRIFKLNMCVKHEVASLLIPVHCECQFLLETDHGVIEPEDNSFVLQSPQRDTKIVYYCLNEQFTITGISVRAKQQKEKFGPVSISFIGLYPSLLDDKDFCVTSSLLSFSDVDWKASACKQYFLFNGTLRFDKMPEITCSSEIVCTIQSYHGDKSSVLGVSVCSAYRVHALQVPNPKYCGPDCSIAFVVNHLSGTGMKVGEGKLIIAYAENVKCDQK